MSSTVLHRSSGRRLCPIAAVVGTILLGVGVYLAHVNMSAASRQLATNAKVLTLNDTSHMRLVSKHGPIVSERGEATGSIPFSPLVMTFSNESTGHGVATLTGYTHGSILSGRAVVTYYAAGHTLYMEGSLTITGGSGYYAHAHGQRLQFKGISDRQTFNTLAKVSGHFEL